MGCHDNYQRIGAETDLELAIQQYQQALEATPEDHPKRAHRLQSLGIGYRDRYQRTGAEKDLELAIQQFQQALKATPEDHPDRARRLESLGIGYSDRYERTGAETDLELAIQQFQQALEATPEDHLDRAYRLYSLGMGYRVRYERTGAETDLELAIQQFQQALEATPEDHPDRAGWLQSLGIGYRDRYQRTGAETDLELAIQQYQQALEATPINHPDRNTWLHFLGMGCHDNYQRIGAETDLELAIQQYQQALEATPEDHPHRAGRLESLGIGYRYRYQRTGAETDLALAIQQYDGALRHPSSPVLDRLRPGVHLLKLHAEAGNWSSAHQIACILTSMIAQLTPHSLDVSDKQYLLAEFSGLASDAAAATLIAGETPYEALQLLELGRGVIMGSINEMRADISNLLQQHPLLGEEYIKLRDQINAPTRHLDQLGIRTVIAHHVNQRYSANQKLDVIMQTIRSLPGFDRFLMAPSEDEFKVAATLGPIVIINISTFRCDALIVEKHEIHAIPLPYLKKSDIQVREAALARPEALDSQLLEWLWEAIANPVLNALGLMRIPDGSLPRIWWILTGPLAKFPIHAAGYHYQGSDTVLDRAISSYSSSVRALLQSRQRRSPPVVERGSRKAVLVGMEKTPGLKDLPFVPLEMDKLGCLYGLLNLQICQPAPCREDVLSALNDCIIFHFAGHGETDQQDPAKSSLILDDGPLAVADLFETNLHNRKPFLAYLSACGTGQIKHDALIDEALHLIAAYQIAGFRHVIGTLWEVNDKTCVDAATILYSCVQERNMTDASVSEGLHRASIKLREIWISENTTRAANRMAILPDEDSPMTTKPVRSYQGEERDSRTAELYEELPLNWVPYVHFGM
ncbi:TPR Domain containing protein [Penicillium malachiteum]|uniref:TPR Domain containing protein n=1 Tax=Penicillium malachiteum TaxID=1324776 RepID=UPI0025488A08|nr:TPR Domain containing protein [Penicillium malachiteum]KAJ5720225.1 TPR Domain containing protein [Penicillium malachiteum]